ncbi:MAG: amino acid permease [Cyclobacteriaceae bacterium]|nr:amino acid permease [Cyclobacteriaceae bacterium]
MAKINKFGTFGGVFTPSILTILGVIMYLRLPMIVGEAGLWATLGIIIVAHIISVTTGLSVSSIATDKKVEAGGTYYMISRSLGLPIGGTLGLALFVGLSFSVSLYLIGFAESFLSYWGFEVTVNMIRITGTIILVVVTTVTFISTSLAIKTQYFIMVAIILSLISILMGSHSFSPQVISSLNAVESPSKSLPFMLLFGIFFPAVTGFEAGVSMSGDLKDPKKSIPSGSIMAIVVGLIVYILLAFFFAFTVDSKILATDSQVLLKISWIPELVIAGIWGATLSSAFGSILGAPRILQATATDKISPRFFSKGVGASNEPRNALLLTFVIAEVGILIGELDVIARVVSIFFITTYGFLNLSCAFERWTSADFRPSFKTPIWVSLLGAVACFIVMIQLDFIATLGASVILGGLYLFLKRKELSLQSGDAWGGIWATLAKTSLQRLTSSKQHNRNWRPNILMFNGNEESRKFMTGLGKSIAGKLGLLSSFELFPSNDPTTKLRRTTESKDESYFKSSYTCSSVYEGIDEIARLYGYAGVEPNTVLMGWSSKAENKEAFLKLISRLESYDLNALFLNHRATGKKMLTPTIDIWWSGWGRNLSLALNIVRHLTSSNSWTRAHIRLMIILNNENDSDSINRYIKNVLLQYRANITLKIIDNHITRQTREEIIATESNTTDLAIIGIPDSHFDDLTTTYKYVRAICDKLPSALFINASSKLEEHNVIKEQEKNIHTTNQNEWILPTLTESRYAEITNDIRKIDERGLHLVEVVHKKIFTTFLAPENFIYEKIDKLNRLTTSALNKVLHYENLYQRHAAIVRAKRYFNDQVVSILEDVAMHFVHEHKELLQEEIRWYVEQLRKDADKFPKFKSVAYSKSEFASNPEDSPALRWFKFRKRFTHPFSRNSISIKANYREGATYFFRDIRYQFLTMLIGDLEKKSSASRDMFLHYISWCDSSFQAMIDISDNPTQNEMIKDFINASKEKTAALINVKNEILLTNKGRLQQEYRKSVLFFMHQLERIDFNAVIRRKRRSEKFYELKREILFTFPSAWAEAIELDLNTIKSNIVLNDYYSFVKQELRGYKNQLEKFFIKEQHQPVNILIETLVQTASLSGQTKQTSLASWDFDYEYPRELLRDTAEKIITRANLLPEENVIVSRSGKETQAITLPIRAMVAHLTESTLIGPINDHLEELTTKLKRANLVINDRASLTIFNLFNHKNEDLEFLRLEEVNDATQSIKKEMESVSNSFSFLQKHIDKQCDDLKNSLKLYHLSDLSGNFSTLVRAQRKKRLQSRLTDNLQSVITWTKNVLVSLLYSQTKGVLLAKKLSNTNHSLSENERIMNLVSSATPNQDILQKLPHYYVSLFSGRSNIGDNFWVDRRVEEKQFEAALQRYKINGNGFILVLGERNTGKTALCKRFCDLHSNEFKGYQLFAPEDGSVSIEEFDNALCKATQLEGGSSEILNLLPHNTMILIHDLELWWERSENGFTIIRHVKSLIEQFSSKCLFVINLNPFAHTIINMVEPLDTHCAGIVRCLPFNSFELKQLLITRHKSSGLNLHFGSGNVNMFSEIRMAHKFNKLFNYSAGNPGVAMNAWLSGIKEFSDKTILWKTPQLEDEDAFDEMTEAWSHLCIQLLLHKRMSLDKLIRTVAMEEHQMKNALQAMKRLQIVSVRGKDIYHLNPMIEFLLISNFRKRGWI